MASFERATDTGSGPSFTIRTSGGGLGLLCLLLAAFLGLFVRLIYIHSHDGARLTAVSERQQRSTVPLAARRGLVTDTHGRILAGSRLQSSIFADAKIVADKPAAATLIAEVLGRPFPEVHADLIAAGERRFFVMARNVTDEQASKIRNANLPGIGTFDESARVYPMGSVAAPLLGFVAGDGHGVTGIEYQFESWLRGASGYKTVVRDVARRAFWLSGDGFQPPRDGLNVVLTIDAAIQENCERVLEEAVAQFKAESAIAIVMRPATGEILAIASVPGFDPHNYQDYGPSRYRNRAITDPMEPGSIFKPFIAAAALNEGVVRLDEVIYCWDGMFRDGSRILHDSHPEGNLSFADVVVKSSNIGMAIVGKRLGNERMHQYVEAFGFGRKTGSGLVTEDAGIMLPMHRWNTFSTTSIPMGHEIAVTPLQVLRGFSAFANGGLLVKPKIVRAVVDDNNEIARLFEDDDEPVRVIPESIAAMVKDQMLVEVVRRGTGVNAALSDYQVFGKTGTAQIPRHGGGGYEPNAYVGSFVGGAPAYAPQLVAIVSVVRPDRKIAYYGGRVAAPSVAKILGHALAYLEVPPDAKVTSSIASK